MCTPRLPSSPTAWCGSRCSRSASGCVRGPSYGPKNVTSPPDLSAALRRCGACSFAIMTSTRALPSTYNLLHRRKERRNGPLEHRNQALRPPWIPGDRFAKAKRFFVGIKCRGELHPLHRRRKREPDAREHAIRAPRMQNLVHCRALMQHHARLLFHGHHFKPAHSVEITQSRRAPPNQCRPIRRQETRPPTPSPASRDTCAVPSPSCALPFPARPAAIPAGTPPLHPP